MTINESDYERWKESRRATRVPDGFADQVLRTIEHERLKQPHASKLNQPLLVGPLRITLFAATVLLYLLRLAQAITVFVPGH